MANITIDIGFDMSRMRSGALTQVLQKVKNLERGFQSLNKSLERTVELLDQMGAARFPGVQNALPSRRTGPTGGSYGPGMRPITVQGRTAPGTGGMRPPTIGSRFDDAFAQHRLYANMNKRGMGGGQQAQAALMNAHNLAMQMPGKAGFNAMNKVLNATPKAPKTVGQKAMDALMTSRIGAGGAMPLVGKLVGLLGPVGTLLAVALPAAIEAFTAGTEALTSNIRNLSLLGGSARSADRAAKMAGLGSGADAASSMRSALGSGAGAGYAASLGINPNFGSFGNMSYGDMVNKVIKDIATSSSFEQARRKAELAGVPEAAQSYYLSNERKASIGKSNAGFSTADNRGIVEFNAALSGAGSALMTLTAKFIQPIIRASSAVLRVTENMSKLATLAEAYGKVQFFYMEAFSTILEWLQSKFPMVFGNSANYSKDNAVREQTKALNDNTRSLNQMREVYGGGSRLNGATPGGLRGQNIGRDALGMGIPI